MRMERKSPLQRYGAVVVLVGAGVGIGVWHNTQTRQGKLWTLEGGAPKAHDVRLGVSDDRYTELVEGDLKEGAQVVVRARTEVAK